MCHLQPCSLVSALDIEPLVCFRAIQDAFIASNFLCNEIESLNKLETQFFALLVFCDGDVFDVADETKAVDTVYSCHLRAHKGGVGLKC